MGRHLYVVLGTIIQAGFGWIPLEETKICSKEMEKWWSNNGLTQISTRRENSDARPTTTTTNSQDAAFSSCLATIDDLEGRCLPLALSVTRFCRLIYPVTGTRADRFPNAFLPRAKFVNNNEE